MRLETLSVFPEVFDSYCSASILGRAQKQGLWELKCHNLRDWTHDRHKTVDDAPFGGGQGMLMKPAPIFEALDELQAEAPAAHIVFFSPCGKPYQQQDARRLAQKKRIIFVCGRYEGMDERVYSLADDIFSLGDYVLTGGELAAMVCIDSIVRLIPGALGDDQSAVDESFSQNRLEYAQYTRPATYRGVSVPEVLLSGDHAKIAAWRAKNALVRTYLRRSDLLDETEVEDAKKLCEEDHV